MKLTPILRRVPDLIAAICLVYVFLFNVQGVSDLVLLPAQAEKIGHALGINQKWNMFAPSPSTWDGWFALAGLRADGRVEDLLHGGQIRRDRSDPQPIRIHPFRYAVYLRYLIERPPDRVAYAEWLCRSWNRIDGRTPALVQVEMHFVLEETPPPGNRPVTETRRLFSHRCNSA